MMKRSGSIHPFCALYSEWKAGRKRREGGGIFTLKTPKHAIMNSTAAYV
jgi:hypothetical protein